jgi:hypothetical protein
VKAIVFVVLLLVAAALLFGSCDVQIMGASGFANELEEDGLAGIPISNVRCAEGVQGWNYVCTYEREGYERSMGFLVDDWDNVLATSNEYEPGETIAPAPGQNVPWRQPAGSATR